MLAALVFAKQYWKLAALGALALLLAVQTVRLGHRSNQLERATINLNECREGRKQDRAAYEQAQRDAKAKNHQEVERENSNRQRITNEREADLNSRIERLRRELRGQPQASGGASRDPGASGVPQSGEGTADPSRVCYAPEIVLRAAENEERHEQLIRWVEEQLGVKR